MCVEEMWSMNILYATDINYLPVCATSLVSLLENNKKVTDLHVYILANDLKQEEERLKQLILGYGRKCTIVSTEHLARWFEEQGVEKFNGGYTTYLRLAIAKLIPELDKVLYLDCDTLILDDISEFYSIDLTGKPAAAVRDGLLAESNYAINRPLHALYYCAGVMLINVQYWKDNNVLEQCISSLKKFDLARTMTAGDQELINYCIGDDIVTVPLRYDETQLMRMFKPENLRLMIHKNDMDFYTVEEINEAIEHPAILHITGYWWGRPWSESCLDPIRGKWESYLQLTPWLNMDKMKSDRPFHSKISIGLYQILPQKLYCFLKLYLEKLKFWRKRNCK